MRACVDAHTTSVSRYPSCLEMLDARSSYLLLESGVTYDSGLLDARKLLKVKLCSRHFFFS